MDRVYFPLSGLVSLVAPTESGKQLELGIVGREGMLGVGVALGIERPPFQGICQTPVTMLSMATEDFRQAARLPLLAGILVRYSEFRLVELVRNASCRHLVEQRLAKWILTASDRLHCDTFPLTHAAIARLLDVRRPGITEAAQKLQAEGLIEYAASEVTVLNPRGLERFACNCYSRIRSELDRFLAFVKSGGAY